MTRIHADEEKECDGVVEAVVPTACLSQALGTRTSTSFERLATHGDFASLSLKM
jgi:hypothetical protein